jgi:hypothetical protein
MRLTKAQLTELALFAEQPAETPEAFVEQLIEKYWDLLAEKHMYAGLMRVEGIPFVLGPCTTRGQVERLGAIPIPFVSPEGWKRTLAETAQPAASPAFKDIADDVEKFKSQPKKRGRKW